MDDLIGPKRDEKGERKSETKDWTRIGDNWLVLSGVSPKPKVSLSIMR